MDLLFIGIFFIAILFVMLPFGYIVCKSAFEVWKEIINNIFNGGE